MKKENKLLARQKKAEEKRKKALKKKLTIIGAVVLVVLIGAGIGVGVKIANDKANAPVTQQFGKYVNKEGKIKGVKIEDCVELGDLNELLQFSAADLNPTDAEVTAQMQSGLSSYEELKTGEGSVLKDGDKVNLDYVGYVDGVAFEGGNTNGQGADLTLGSGTYIDDFEEQLVGHKVGDEVTVEVTFPDAYSNADLAGKDAVFEVVINGVYVVDITDALVAENIDGCTTVEEYREQVRQSLYQANLNDAAWNAIAGGSEIKEFPEDFCNNLMELNAYYYQAQYTAMNEAYYSYYGYYVYDSIEDYYGMTTDERETMITYYTTMVATFTLLCQAIYEDAGLTVTDQDKLDFIVSLGYGEDEMETAVEDYGKNYITHGAITIAAQNYVNSITVVTE